MARMIPNHGPAPTSSRVAEPDLYRAFAQQLSDDFTVIHSIPWLSAAAKEIDGRLVPTGELDFLILHPHLGMLGVEVKGGLVAHDRSSFVLLKSGERIYPINQVRRSIHALAPWLVEKGCPTRRIGYAIAFPRSEVADKPLPPGLVDIATGKSRTICMDMTDLLKIEARITEIMKFWQSELGSYRLTSCQINDIVDLLCPIADYSPKWSSRIANDCQWLLLTDEQKDVLDALNNGSRHVLQGRSGTGKTLIALTHARELAAKNLAVMVLVYNVKLAQKLKKLLEDTSITVLNFHELCRKSASLLNEPTDDSKEWYKESGPGSLARAVKAGLLPWYDALIIDEAQVFQKDWLDSLQTLLHRKYILACCDETQVFNFEETITAAELSSIIFAASPFKLTANIRSPKAIFKRLRSMLPTSDCQEISIRPDDDDALVEIVSVDPCHSLCDEIVRLNREGISSDSVTVLYLSYNPTDHLNKEFTLMIKEIAPVHRYRGLESPVIIIFAPDCNFVPTEIASAYSRATSLCITIYSSTSFANKNCQVHQLIAKENKSINDQMAKFYPINAHLEVTQAVKFSADIAWAHKWGQWVVLEKLENCVGTSLWKHHIRHTNENSILEIGKEMLDRFTLRPFFSAHVSDNHSIRGKEVSITWCDKCNGWAKAEMPKSQSEKVTCRDCEIASSIPAPNVLPEYVKYDSILHCYKKYTKKDIDSLSIFLRALGRWLHRLTEDERNILSRFYHGGGTPFNDAGRILTGIDLFKASSYEIFDVESVSSRYYQDIPSLRGVVSFKDWKNSIALNLSVWFGSYNWVTKERKGVYRRVGSPPLKQ